MLIRPRSLTEAREGGARAARKLVAGFQQHEAWCRETFIPRFQARPTSALVGDLYNTQLIYSWCMYSPKNPDHQKLLRKKMLLSAEEVKTMVTNLFLEGRGRERWSELIGRLLECARHQGYSHGKKGFCIATTPFFEEIELMVEVLKLRHYYHVT